MLQTRLTGVVALGTALLAAPRPFAQDSPVVRPAVLSATGPASHVLHYGVEWRLIRAGVVTMRTGSRHGGGRDVNLTLQSAGLVSKLYTVEDKYAARLNEQFCLQSYVLNAREGKRVRDTHVTVEGTKANYNERDLVKNAVVLTKQTDVPACVSDVLGALQRLRTLPATPGQSLQVPITDGKRFAQVKVDAQERESITTPAGRFNTLRYEVHMMNGVIFPRDGRLFVWLTDDERRLPVQVRLRMQFYIGTVTVQLEKEEKA